MGKILIPGSGSGADLDVITAEASDVLAPKVTVDRDGELVTGTLALTGSAAAGDVRQGRSFYTTNPKAKQAGTMAERGAATYTPSTYNQVIQGNQFLTGAQTILGDGNLASQYIKKGVTIFGVTGSWEGYVPTVTDLYLRGNNIAGFSSDHPDKVFFQSGQIYLSNVIFSYSNYILTSNRAFTLRGHSRFLIEADIESTGYQSPATLTLKVGGQIIANTTFPAGVQTIVIPLNPSLAVTGNIEVIFTGRTSGHGSNSTVSGKVFRIYYD